jgi:hypothetical protein
MTEEVLGKVLEIGEKVGDKQGWGVFWTGAKYEVERFDEEAILDGDQEAWALARAAGIDCSEVDGSVLGLIEKKGGE